MKRWSVSVNGFYGKAQFTYERGPRWAFWMGDTLTAMIMYAPCWRVPLIGRIPLWRDNERTTVDEYYGSELCHIAAHLFNKLSKVWHRRLTIRWVDTSLADLLQAMGDEAPAEWQREWDFGTSMWEEDGPPPQGHSFRTANPSWQEQARITHTYRDRRRATESCSPTTNHHQASDADGSEPEGRPPDAA